LAIICAFGLFSTYVLNVVLSATMGVSFLGEVQEMLVLLGASIAFTVVILRSEAKVKGTKENND
jgi:hypothetical protein